MKRSDVINRNFRNNIIFSEEAIFMLNATTTHHDGRYWTDENTHWMREDPMYPIESISGQILCKGN